MTVPLDLFCSALKKGLGRAMILLSETPDNSEFSQALLHACLVNQVYDRQCEEDRVKYLYDLISQTGKREFYRSHLFHHLLASDQEVEEVDKAQIYGILCCIAAERHDDDRRVLHEFLIEADYHGIGSICMYWYVWLEGIDGFLFCFRHFFENRTDDLLENRWVFSLLLGALKERDGEDASMEALERARSGWPKLDELLRLNAAKDSATVSEPEVGLDYTAAKVGLDLEHGFPRSWINSASAEDLMLAARDLLNESDQKKIWLYLGVFRGKNFPLPPSELFRFVESEDKRISFAAVWALRRLSHPDVRELALKKIVEGSNPDLAIRLLASNFQSGDLRAVEALIDRFCPNEQTWHDIGRALLELLRWASVSPEESRSLLLKLYEEAPCSLCRGGFVRKLSAAGHVPDWMAKEARFDADPRTASLFKVDAGAASKAQVETG